MDELHNEQIDELGWYCVHTKPKCEHIAAAHLLQLPDVDVFCPRIRFRRATRRGKVWFTEALFPGYIFARFTPRHLFRGVSHAAGVIRILRFGQRLASLPDESIAAIRDQVGEGDIKEIDPAVSIGDEIQVVQGPMAGFSGIVTRLHSGQHRVKVLLEFLGRESLVDIPVDRITTGISPRNMIAGNSPRR